MYVQYFLNDTLFYIVHIIYKNINLFLFVAENETKQQNI